MVYITRMEDDVAGSVLEDSDITIGQAENFKGTPVRLYIVHSSFQESIGFPNSLLLDYGREQPIKSTPPD